MKSKLRKFKENKKEKKICLNKETVNNNSIYKWVDYNIIIRFLRNKSWFNLHTTMINWKQEEKQKNGWIGNR